MLIYIQNSQSRINLTNNSSLYTIIICCCCCCCCCISLSLLRLPCPAWRPRHPRMAPRRRQPPSTTSATTRRASTTRSAILALVEESSCYIRRARCAAELSSRSCGDKG
ncbi:hypothetical protein K504DRAFT_234416 [Pleomassaria siparia CBS 279.74]|uniref:Uncharacterized protein n=1 Tax=Pleomassaria siparia CBS 279.74 TaxID=1314801 RepID=A0A6G1KED4_9PLEO|nr:hypothetical protein K504DRAFT_234416 [Pleomassaria siparia CBS 279.74]